MQRQEMLAQLQDTLQEPSGIQGASAKFRLSYLLNEATDDIAGKYKCLYGTTSGNLVANQALYSPPSQAAETTQPSIIEIYALECYDSSGNLHTLQPMTVQAMDADYAGWRAWLANSCPYFFVTTAMGSSFVLTPVPNYNSNYDPTGMNPGGYTAEGVVVPGHSWDALTAECPLPTHIHSAVVLQAALARISQNPTKDNIARAPMLERRLQSLLDTFESTVTRYTQATRVPSYATGQNPGASPGFGFNPLDL